MLDSVGVSVGAGGAGRCAKKYEKTSLSVSAEKYYSLNQVEISL